MTDLVVIVSDVQLLVSPEIVLTSILSILHFSYYPCEGREGGREGGREEEGGGRREEGGGRREEGGGRREEGGGRREEGGGRREECNGKYTTYCALIMSND